MLPRLFEYLLLGGIWLVFAVASGTGRGTRVNTENLGPTFGADIHKVENFRLLTHISGLEHVARQVDPHLPHGEKITVQFDAFGRTYKIPLVAHKALFTEDAYVRGNLEDGSWEVRAPRLVAYTGRLPETGGWVRVTVTRDKLMHCHFLEDGDIRVVEPARKHIHALSAPYSFSSSDLIAYSYSLKQKQNDAEEFIQSIIQAKFHGMEPSAVAHPIDSTGAYDLPHGRKLATLMPTLVKGCIAWTNTPYGVMDASCPSTTKEISMGMAHDTGYTKALTDYGTSSITATDAITWVEEDTQHIINIINVVYVDMLNVYIRLAALEVRTVAGGEAWNEEPLNPDINTGSTRATNGCYTSRTYGTSADTGQTLENFRAWFAALSSSYKYGFWHMLTNCYPPSGTVGLAYVGVTCSTSYGAGWSNFMSQGPWEIVAHEVGHNFAAQHTFSTGGIMSYDSEKEFKFSGTNPTEMCSHVSSKVSVCYKSFTPVCGNGVLEPGEQCDDTTSCCNQATCQLVSGAVCSPGYSAECCTTSCQYESVIKTCTVCSGNDGGYCYNGVCRQNYMATKYSNLGNCASPASAPCIEYVLYSSSCYSSASFSGGPTYKTDGGYCGTNSACQSGVCVTSTSAPTVAGQTNSPTASPTRSPTAVPTTKSPTAAPTPSPTRAPTASPTVAPTRSPTNAPTSSPTLSPTVGPTSAPTRSPTATPTLSPTVGPTSPPVASNSPTLSPTATPTLSPTATPSSAPSRSPTEMPTAVPSSFPTYSPSALSFIYITRPSSGEVLYNGDVATFVWLSSADVSFVNVVLTSSAGSVTLTNSVLNTGSYQWTVSRTAAHDYYITVTSTSNPSIFATSDLFTIQDVASISITSPSASSSIDLGSSVALTWTYTGDIAEVEVSLYESSVKVATIGTTENDGSFDFVIPTSLSPSSQYQIAVASTSASQTNAVGYVSISITDPPAAIPLAFINVPTELEVGQSVRLSWESAATTTHIALYLKHYNKPSFSQKLTSGTNTNGFDWTVSADAGVGYYFQLTDTQSDETTSTGSLVVYAAQPRVTAVDPLVYSSGAIWSRGVEQTVRYTATGGVSYVEVSLYDRDDQTLVLFENTKTTSLRYTPPYTTPPADGSRYYVQVKSNVFPWTYQTSSTVFSINDYSYMDSQPVLPSQTISLTYPSLYSMSTFYKGKQCIITWTSTGVSKVDIFLWLDDVKVAVIASAAANANKYEWTVPFTVTSAFGYQLQVVSTSNYTVESSAVNMTLADDTSGPKLQWASYSRTWVQGVASRISWTSGGLTSFLQLTIESTGDVLATNLPTAGSVDITIPVDTNKPDNTEYVLVLSTSDGSHVARSKPITLYWPAAVTVTTPQTGGLVWDKGASYYVRWSTVGQPMAAYVQLYRGNPARRTVNGVSCVPHKTSDGSVYNDCVTDPSSSNYGYCATSTNVNGYWSAGGLCADLRSHFQLLISEKAAQGADKFYLSIPADKSTLPTPGTEYYVAVKLADNTPDSYAMSSVVSISFPAVTLYFNVEADVVDSNTLLSDLSSVLGISMSRFEFQSSTPIIPASVRFSFSGRGLATMQSVVVDVLGSTTATDMMASSIGDEFIDLWGDKSSGLFTSFTYPVDNSTVPYYVVMDTSDAKESGSTNSVDPSQDGVIYGVSVGVGGALLAAGTAFVVYKKRNSEGIFSSKNGGNSANTMYTTNKWQQDGL